MRPPNPAIDRTTHSWTAVGYPSCAARQRPALRSLGVNKVSPGAYISYPLDLRTGSRLEGQIMKLQVVQWVLLLFGMVAVAGAKAECDPEESALWNQRYELRGSEVYDNTTDLTWARCPVGMNWQEDSGCLGKALAVKQTKA